MFAVAASLSAPSSDVVASLPSYGTPPTPQRLFPLPPPPPAAPPTGILQNLRSWFENDEYATDTMRRPRLSPRPRRSGRRSAGVELSTFAQRAASPVRFALEALSPAPVRGENPLSRWV